jgi:hypothetical protein
MNNAGNSALLQMQQGTLVLLTGSSARQVMVEEQGGWPVIPTTQVPSLLDQHALHQPTIPFVIL